MPNTIKTLRLTDAIKALPSGHIVEYALWAAAGSSLPGFVQGTWGPWIVCPRPYTVTIRAATTRYTVTSGGDEYIRACTVYCTGGLPVELLPPATRSARVRVGRMLVGVAVFGPDYYRVMEIRTWPDTSDHAEIHCKRDLGEAPGQA